MFALHLDLKRSMYRPAYFATIVKRAAGLGFDTILLEFEDKLLIDALRRAVGADAWTERDLRGFLRLCKQHGLAVIPKLPVLSHLEWWLQWPWWYHLREDNCTSQICPLHPETPPLVRHLVAEVLRMFPEAPAVHLGGDEAFFVGTCPRCRADGRSPGQLYVHHYLPLIEQVEAAGKCVMLYGDMILGDPEILDAMPRSVTVCDPDYQAGTADEVLVWNFSPDQPGTYLRTPDQLRKLPGKLRRFRRYFTDGQGKFVPFGYCRYLKANGYAAVTLPAAKCYGANYCAPKTVAQSVNCMTASRCRHEYGLDGVLVSCWTVRMNHLETNWPILAAGAWSHQDPGLTVRQASRRFARQWFGLDTPELFDIVDPLGVCLPDTRYGHNMWPMPNVLCRRLEYVFADPSSDACREVDEMLAEAGKGYSRARRQLRRLAPRVHRNRTMFQHWLLAADTLCHKVKSLPMFIRVAQGKRPGAGRARFVREIDDLAQRHRRLFSRTMTPGSVDFEVRVRFGENRELLTR